MERNVVYSTTLWIILIILGAEFAGADWAKLTGTPSTFWYVGLSADAHGTVYLYESTGGGGDRFWRYDIMGDNWQQLSNTPIVGRGAYLEADTLTGLVYWQSGATRFFVFDPGTGLWNELSPTPVPAWSDGYVMTNSDMCINPLTSKLYWHSGDRAFFEYDITLDTWTQKDSTLVSGNGDMVVHPGLNKIYWHQGFDPNSGHQNGFYEYDIAGDVWQSLTPTPVTNANGGLAILPVENMIYWSRGGLSADFMQYDIPTGIWTQFGTTPKSGQFGNLAADWGENVIYYYAGFSINPDSIFWRYTSSPGIRDRERRTAALPDIQCVSTIFKDRLTLRFPSAFSHRSPVTCAMYDISGQLLFEECYSPVPASVTLENTEMRKLPPGVYLLITRLGSHSASFKTVKIE